jgi:hypothetical protein
MQAWKVHSNKRFVQNRSHTTRGAMASMAAAKGSHMSGMAQSRGADHCNNLVESGE